MQSDSVKTHNWGVKWTEEEDARLLLGIETYGYDKWKEVGELVGTRTAGILPDYYYFKRSKMII
jgi:hypothetical protein